MKIKLYSLATILLTALFFFVSAGLWVFSSQAATSTEKQKVLIGFSEIPGPAEVALIKRFGGEVKHSYTLIPAIAATLPERAINALLKNPKITVIEPDGKIYAINFEQELENSWGVKHIQADEVHNTGNLGTGIKIAVIDTGINSAHPDLKVNGGYNFVNNTASWSDDNGHGTHVAGIIGGLKDGVGVVGVAPEAELYALKVLNSSGSGNWSNVIAALEWAVKNDIQITNNSYGSSGDPGTLVKTAFDTTYEGGILHVAAAGNDGSPRGIGNNVGYPARYASVIAVAATDKNDKRASWSSTGPDLELSAPGVGIYSTWLTDTYRTISGTSMASPHVAGVAALVMATGKSDILQIRQILRDSATSLGSHNHYGYGLVNAASAVGLDEPPQDPENPEEPGSDPEEDKCPPGWQKQGRC